MYIWAGLINHPEVFGFFLNEKKIRFDNPSCSYIKKKKKQKPLEEKDRVFCAFLF